MARPTKYKKEYCELLIEHMAQGFSFESFAGTIRVCRDSLYEWEKKHEEFSYAKKVGFSVCLLFWEELGLTSLTSGVPLNTGVYCFNMKNRFNWVDRVESKVTNETISINIDSDDLRL